MARILGPGASGDIENPSSSTAATPGVTVPEVARAGTGTGTGTTEPVSGTEADNPTTDAGTATEQSGQDQVVAPVGGTDGEAP